MVQRGHSLYFNTAETLLNMDVFFLLYLLLYISFVLIVIFFIACHCLLFYLFFVLIVLSASFTVRTLLLVDVCYCLETEIAANNGRGIFFAILWIC